MKNLQTITSLVALGAMTATPFLALADDGAGGRAKVEDRARFETAAQIKFTDLFGRDDRSKFTAGVNATTSARAKADGMIDARIDKLVKLEDRVDDLSRLTAEQKAALTASITAQINSLTALKARIESSASTTVEQNQELVKSNRAAALVASQVAISAASNRVLSVAGQMEAFAPKLQTRIASSSAAGIDVTAANTAYTDMLASLAEAKVEAQAAASAVVNLKADNGNQTVFQANQAAIKDARAKLKAAHEALVEARKDIATIFRVIQVKFSASVSTR